MIMSYKTIFAYQVLYDLWMYINKTSTETYHIVFHSNLVYQDYKIDYKIDF